MKTPLIALTGLAGCGKSTIALGLVKHCGFHRLSFADPIRAMLRALGLTDEQMSKYKHEPLALLGGKTPRQAMQSLGTEWGRDLVYHNLWVEATRQRILSAWSVGKVPGVVIDDCRFDNEAIMVKDMGGIVIAVDRMGVTRMNHASENGVSLHLIDERFANTFETIDAVCVAATKLV